MRYGTKSGFPVPPSLRRNIAFSLSGTVFLGATRALSFVVLAKLGTPEMVGALALGLAVTAPIFRFCSMNLRSVLASDPAERFPFVDYLTFGLITAALGVVVVGAVGVLGVFGEDKLWVLISIGVAVALTYLSEVFYGFLQKRERFDLIVRAQVAWGVAGLVGFVGGLILSGTVVGACIGLAAASAATILTVDTVYVLRTLHGPEERAGSGFSLRPRWHSATVLTIARLSFPLGLVALLAALNNSIPRYLVQLKLGDYDMGIFTALVLPMLAAHSVLHSVGHAALPRLARFLTEKRPGDFGAALLRLCGVAVLAATTGLVVALVAGGPVLELLYTAEYATHSALFSWVFIAAFFAYMGWVLDAGILGGQRFVVQPVILAVGCLASATASFLLIPPFGLLGAVWAVAASFVVTFVLRLVVVVRIMREHNPGRSIASATALP